MARFSDMLGGHDPDDDAKGDAESASGDAIERLAQYAAAPSQRNEPAPRVDEPSAAVPAEVVAAFPAVDDTFLPSRARRH